MTNNFGKIIAAFAAVLIASGSPVALADGLNDKLCSLSAATKLPAIPGLSPQKSNVTVMPADQALRRVVDSVYDVRSATAVADTFGGFDYETDNQIKRTYETTGIRAILMKSIGKKVTGGATVDIDFKAVGLEATQSFLCVWGDGYGVYTKVSGITK
jgi:hypothetical protein